MRIRAWRHFKKWTQIKAAQKIGIQSSTLCRWELGNSVPDAEEVSQIARAFGISMVAFYSRRLKRAGAESKVPAAGEG